MKKRMSLEDKADAAIKKAVKIVIKQHKKSGRPLAIWKNGRTVLVPANKIR
jgi:hypothetical protein